jgi:hypothetical protein
MMPTTAQSSSKFLTTHKFFEIEDDVDGEPTHYPSVKKGLA